MPAENATPALSLDSEAATLAIVDGFRARTLPHARWTHHAHLVVGLWHVLNLPPGGALDALRSGIRAYNTAVGTPNSDTDGYHKTITAFYAWAIDRFVREAEAGSTFLDLARRLLASRCAQREFPFEYYSRNRLLSVAARRGWLAADLKPLD